MAGQAVSAAPLPKRWLLGAMRLVSRAKGEYAGPCPFTGLGHDRFHIWRDSPIWWCRRGDCPTCPGLLARSGYGRWGLLDEGAPRPLHAPTSHPPPIPMETVFAYARGLDSEALEYLASRGIRRATARRYLLGRHRQRLTIPNLVRVRGHLHCLGIKKRWLGTPPESWIERYLMEPGSRGAALFNWNRLVGRAHRSVLIVEGVLDTILLDQLGIPAVAPFGGGAVWSADWSRWFARVERILVVADNDGGRGLELAERTLRLLGRGTLVLPPGGAKDVGEAYLAGENLPRWAASLVV